MNQNVEAYPLSWPVMYPRTATHLRQKARFDPTSFASARDELIHELERMGASDGVLSTNMPLRRDGLPGGTQRIPDDRGVAVYFNWKNKPRSLACDKWLRIEDNMHALALTIMAMRGLERWGASNILDRAFTGMVQLPAPEQWWDVLGVASDAPLSKCESNFKIKMKSAHPDKGGSEYLSSKLNWAIAEARRVSKEAEQ